MRHVISLILASVGPGSVISYDDGYYPGRVTGEKEPLPWVSIPRTVVVIGKEDSQTANTLRRRPMLVCVEQGDRPPYDGFYILPPDLRGVRGLRVVRLVPGDLPEIVPNVPAWGRE